MLRHLAALALFFACLPNVLAHGGTPGTEPVRIGILNFESREILGAQWQEFEELLKQRLHGGPVEVELLDNQALERAVASRNLDFVLTTSGHYIKLHQQYGLSSPLATMVRNFQGTPLHAYGGVIFTRADHPDIAQLADLDDHKIATVGTGGFAGYLVQAHTLWKATGRQPGPEQLLVTGQPHNKVVQAVLEGRADVGFVRSGMLESLAKYHGLDLDQVRVLNQQDLPGYPFLSSTLLYPEWPIAAIPHTDHELINRLTALLLTLSADGRPATDRLYGFDIPADYQTSEKLLRELRAPPFDAPVDLTLADVWDNYKPHVVAITLFAGALLVGIAMFARQSHALATARDKVKLEHERLANILWGTGAGTWEWHIPSGKVHFNERWAEIIGYRLEELEPLDINTWIEHTHPDDLEQSNSKLQEVFQRREAAYECEVRMKHKQGHWVWVLDRGKVTKWSPSGKPLTMAGTHSDITEKKHYEQQLQHIATSDALTGLPNRTGLMNRLELAMAIQARHGGHIVIVFIDLDGFKEVNDTHGHEAGDELLKRIAARFKGGVRAEDTVARLGGDEFVVVLNGLTAPRECIPTVERLLVAAAESVLLGGVRVTVSASAGITSFPQHGVSDTAELFRQADHAMYQAKQAGRSTYQFAEELPQQDAAGAQAAGAASAGAQAG